MKTSEEIYNRIMTDSQLNKNLFNLVYKDVIKKKYIDISVIKWIPVSKGGDIPWHRVDFIKFKDKIIWDRINKTCTIDECIVEETNDFFPLNFKITSFNVLSDEYEKQITNISKRMENILNYAFDDNDIMCLQEVQPKLLEELKNRALAEKKYIAHTKIGFNDIVIISKINYLDYELIDLGHRKCAILVNFRVDDDNILIIVGIHLTSDYYNENSSKRTSQLFKIKKIITEKENENKKMNKNTYVILLGDTNESKYEEKLQHFYEYVDCWIDLKETKEFTYNPLENNLAKKLSQDKIPKRLDRILYKKNDKMNCIDVCVDKSVFFSDHYPITANFVMKENNEKIEILNNITDDVKYTNQTALCIIPPYDIWNEINNHKISNSLERWMPHINLFFGFVEPEYFYEVYNNIKKIDLSEYSDMFLEFDKIDYYKHEKNYTLYLKPSENTLFKLREIYDKLCSSSIIKLKQYDVKKIYNPHISLGNTEDESKIIFAIKKRINIKFNLLNLSFVSRIGLEYFKVLKNIVIGKKPIHFYLDFLKSIVNSENVEFNLCGSRYFNLNNPDNLDSLNSSDGLDNSDADILCIGNKTRDDFFSKISKIFETCGYFRKVLIVKNKHVFCLKLKTNDMSFDIQYVDKNNENDIYCKSAIAILKEPQFIIKNIEKKHELFLKCLNWTKNQMKENQIYSSIHSFIGGISTAIIIGTIVKKSNVTDFESFLQELKSLNYDEPIHIGTLNNYNVENPCDKLLYIGTSTIPIQNTARHICRSTSFLLKYHFKCGFDSLELVKLKEIFKSGIIFKIISTDDDSLENAITWFNGIVVQMIVAIERCSKDIILFPSTKWIEVNDKYMENQLIKSWTLKSSENYSIMTHIADKIISKSESQFTNAYLSWEFCNFQ